MLMRTNPEESAIESIVAQVENQSADREHGCLSMAAERSLVAEI